MRRRHGVRRRKCVRKRNDVRRKDGAGRPLRPVASAEVPAMIRAWRPAARLPREARTFRDVGACDPFMVAATVIPTPVTWVPDVAGPDDDLFGSWRRWGCFYDDFGWRGGGGFGIGCRRWGGGCRGCSLLHGWGRLAADGCSARWRSNARRRCRLGGGTRGGWGGVVATADGDSDTEHSYEGHVSYDHGPILHCGLDCELARRSLRPDN